LVVWIFLFIFVLSIYLLIKILDSMESIKRITEDEFEEQFTTVENHLDDNASYSGCMFETYGEEVDYVFELSQNEKRVWTIIEGDDDKTYYATGFHRVNRIGYLVTEEEYTEEMEVELDW